MKLNTIIKILAKVMEVIYLLGAVIMLVLALTSLILPSTVYSFITNAIASGELSFSGDLAEYMDVWNLGQKLAMKTVALVAFSGILKALMYTMIFRNIDLIFSYAEGKGKYSQGKTPFQKDIVRMVRELGIFTIGISVVNVCFGAVATAFTGLHLDTFNLSLESLVIGIAMIGLSQYFAYGENLEKEVEGLV